MKNSNPTSRFPVKIIDLINEKQDSGESFVAFEYYPPRTEDGVKNLKTRFTKMETQSKLLVFNTKSRAITRGLFLN